jgi:hypothetical protein
MHKSEIHLHYAYLKLRGHNYHLLTTNFKELVAGHASSDFMGYFGLGSGEMEGARIDGLTMPITTVEVPDTEVSLLMWKDNPRFIGFVDARPEHPVKVVLSGGTESVYELPINWQVYTRLGVPALATQHLGAMRRAWIAYETPEENYDRMTDFMRLVNLFG